MRLQRISSLHTLRALRLCESYLSAPFKLRTPFDKISRRAEFFTERVSVQQLPPDWAQWFLVGETPRL